MFVAGPIFLVTVIALTITLALGGLGERTGRMSLVAFSYLLLLAVVYFIAFYYKMILMQHGSPVSATVPVEALSFK